MPADLPADWKALRKLREATLERFCTQVLAEVARVASGGGQTSHARYLAVCQLIQERDEQIARVFNHPRRSVALARLAGMTSLGLVGREELQSFSSRTRSAVEAWRQSMGRTRAARGAHG